MIQTEIAVRPLMPGASRQANNHQGEIGVLTDVAAATELLGYD